MNLVLYGSAARSKRRIDSTNKLSTVWIRGRIPKSRGQKYRSAHRKLLCVVVLTLDSRNKKSKMESTNTDASPRTHAMSRSLLSDTTHTAMDNGSSTPESLFQSPTAAEARLLIARSNRVQQSHESANPSVYRTMSLAQLRALCSDLHVDVHDVDMRKKEAIAGAIERHMTHAKVVAATDSVKDEFAGDKESAKESKSKSKSNAKIDNQNQNQNQLQQILALLTKQQVLQQENSDAIRMLHANWQTASKAELEAQRHRDNLERELYHVKSVFDRKISERIEAARIGKFENQISVGTGTFDITSDIGKQFITLALSFGASLDGSSINIWEHCNLVTATNSNNLNLKICSERSDDEGHEVRALTIDTEAGSINIRSSAVAFGLRQRQPIIYAPTARRPHKIPRHIYGRSGNREEQITPRAADPLQLVSVV